MHSELSNEASKFLNEQLKTHPYELTNDDKHVLKTRGLAEFIFSRITRSKFRRTSLDSDTVADIKFKIKYQILNNDPISFSVPFGAYKNWHLSSFPEPDWGEVFNINYMLRFLAPISAVYEPGAKLQYSYSDNVMDIVSNIPKEYTKRYITVFDKLLSLFQQSASKNIILKSIKINDFYAEGEQFLEMNNNYEDNRKNWFKKYPENVRLKKLASAKHNLMLNGIQDLSTLDGEQLEARFLQSAMWCDALDSLQWRRKFNKGSTNIQIVYVKGPYLSLHLGACETSVGQAWAMTGVLEKRGLRLLQTIVSHATLKSFEVAKNIQLINVDTLFRELSNNYLAIPFRDI
ncbi:MAG: hypothetical protein Q8M94_03315 [Ignavibacteria bacterium]|nr:hypothetical protein [Ignavibacteria bacterium]